MAENTEIGEKKHFCQVSSDNYYKKDLFGSDEGKSTIG
jgi:hypothetical protein